ncbi:hypothetical protein P8452_19679 [Trifolium repens]|nr:hypothetical protein P8452_19679 [Trifolium repens]
MKVDNINDDVCWEPAAGMCFSCLDEVKSFYGEYALKKGFRWKIRTSRKGPDGEICYLILACSREGSKVSKVSCTSKTLPEKVKSCPAKICVKMEEDGLWYIRKFEADHSHETSPTKARRREKQDSSRDSTPSFFFLHEVIKDSNGRRIFAEGRQSLYDHIAFGKLCSLLLQNYLVCVQ